MSQDIPWDFKHWGDPEDYINYDPDANYVDTLDTELLDSVRDSLVAAQDQGLIQNLESHYDGNQERDQPTHTEDRNKSMTPHRRWHSDKTKDGTEYHLVDSNIDAGVWKENGHWKMSFALDAGANYYQADLGKTRFVRKALNRAEITIMDAQIQVHQSYRDVQNVVNLAKETEDRTPEEQASIDRLEESLIMGRPDFPDPSDEWLQTFEHEMQEREEDRDRGNGYDV
jgi:hypothetical protein